MFNQTTKILILFHCHKVYLVILLALFPVTLAIAQDVGNKEKTFELSGRINCINPINGTLSSVVIHNINKDIVTVSDEKGAFAIIMGEQDTIVFSTPEHLDYIYTLEDTEESKDHNIVVFMETDAIWLNTVTIIGLPSLERFKSEVLDLMLPSNQPDLALPVVNKYARQYASGDGETDLVGPLTYLQKKFSRYHRLKSKVD
jgi:hypothetical protein